VVMKMERNERYIAAITIAVLAALALGTAALADPGAPTALTTVQSSARNTSQLPAQSVDARGGNVTEVNIQALTQTSVWQGYYGSITGEITLDNANNFTFYNWSLATVRGEVYATRNAAITWGNANCSNTTQRDTEDVYVNRTSADGDSVVNTYSQTSHPAFSVGGFSVAANSCYSTYGFVNNASQGQNWSMVLLHDDTSIIYASIINDSVMGFDGAAHDFQLLVAENENAGFIGTTPYYFWVEMS